MKRLANRLKLACAFVVAAAAVLAWQGDARAQGAAGCWFGFIVCVDGCNAHYSTEGELNTCGGICGNGYLTCIGYGLHTPIPENYAD